MSTVSTEGLDFKTDRLTPNQPRGHLDQLLPEGCVSTDPLDLHADALAPHSGPHPMRSFVVAIVTAFGTILPGESSRRIHPVWMTMLHCLQEEEERVTDFLEPVTFNWDRDIHIARMAARGYSQQTYADY